MLPGTEIEGTPEVGAQVKMEGVEQPDGVVVAKEGRLRWMIPARKGIHFVGVTQKVGEGYIEVGILGLMTWKVEHHHAETKVEGTLAEGKGVAVLGSHHRP